MVSIKQLYTQTSLWKNSFKTSWVLHEKVERQMERFKTGDEAPYGRHRAEIKLHYDDLRPRKLRDDPPFRFLRRFHVPRRKYQPRSTFRQHSRRLCSDPRRRTFTKATTDNEKIFQRRKSPENWKIKLTGDYRCCGTKVAVLGYLIGGGFRAEAANTGGADKVPSSVDHLSLRRSFILCYY